MSRRWALLAALLIGCDVHYSGKPGIFVCKDFRDGEEIHFHTDTIRDADLWNGCVTVTTLDGQERIICAPSWKCKPDEKP